MRIRRGYHTPDFIWFVVLSHSEDGVASKPEWFIRRYIVCYTGFKIIAHILPVLLCTWATQLVVFVIVNCQRTYPVGL